MRPSEVEKIAGFRNALLKIYANIGSGGRDRKWTTVELTDELKRLLEFYDKLFSENITSGQ